MVCRCAAQTRHRARHPTTPCAATAFQIRDKWWLEGGFCLPCVFVAPNLFMFAQVRTRAKGLASPCSSMYATTRSRSRHPTEPHCLKVRPRLSCPRCLGTHDGEADCVEVKLILHDPLHNRIVDQFVESPASEVTAVLETMDGTGSAHNCSVPQQSRPALLQRHSLGKTEAAAHKAGDTDTDTRHGQLKTEVTTIASSRWP